MPALHTLGWACYLGASWTWVIGMLLPILLLRDYGPWGWVAFAVPNVLGAMAMGFVLDRVRSARIVAEHRTACAGFSRVTMAYQVIALPWALVLILDWPLRPAVLAAVAVCAAVAAVVVWRPVVSAVVISAGTLALLGWFALQPEAWVAVFTDHRVGPRLGDRAIYAFLPAAVFGFLLSPYLDLTFHRARQEAGRAAFVLGFGVVFLAAIVLSLAYAGLGAIALLAGMFPVEDGPLRWLLGGYILVQAAFTLAVHLRELRRVEAAPPLKLALPLLLFLLVGAYLVRQFPESIAAFEMTAAEMIYRTLLLLYGTVFPLYVLVMMVPTRRDVPRERKLLITLLAGSACLPAAFVAFVEGRAAYVAVVVLIVVVARLVASHGGGQRLQSRP